MMWFVYIVRCADTSLYTGITNDLHKRLKAHNEGKASKYTRARLPVEYVWIQAVSDRSEASKLEAQLKKLPKAEKERISEDWCELHQSAG